MRGIKHNEAKVRPTTFLHALAISTEPELSICNSLCLLKTYFCLLSLKQWTIPLLDKLLNYEFSSAQLKRAS